MSSLQSPRINRDPDRGAKAKGRGGNLYYVRLNTSVGTVYKLGFTTMKSAFDRLAYAGNNDDKLIDSVLLFRFFEDASKMEGVLHAYFKNKRAFPSGMDKRMPLFGNGQSELYIEDILGLDLDYSLEQKLETEKQIYCRSLECTGLDPEQIKRNADSQFGPSPLDPYLAWGAKCGKRLIDIIYAVFSIKHVCRHNEELVQSLLERLRVA